MYGEIFHPTTQIFQSSQNALPFPEMSNLENNNNNNGNIISGGKTKLGFTEN